MNRVWYSSNKNLKSPDTVHQVLMFGSLKDIQTLKTDLGKNTIRKLFLKHPKKIYTASSLNFIKNFILDITTSVDEQKYLKYTPRYPR